VGYSAWDHAVLPWEKKKSVSRILEEREGWEHVVVLTNCHKEGNALDYKEAGIDV